MLVNHELFKDTVKKQLVNEWQLANENVALWYDKTYYGNSTVYICHRRQHCSGSVIWSNKLIIWRDNRDNLNHV